MPKTKWDPVLWEKKLMKMILAQEAGVAQIFNDFINASAPHLAKYSPPKNGQLWHRNKAIEAQLNKQLITLHSNLSHYLREQTISAWGLSSRKTDLLVADYIHGLSISKLASDGMLSHNLTALQEFQKRKVSGMDLSSRIWKVCDQAKENIGMYLQSGIGTGRSATQQSKDIRAMLKNPDKRFRRVRDPETGKLKLSKPMAGYHPGQGVYRSSYRNALRVTRTETNMAYRFADQARWNKLDFVLGYEVKLSSSHPVVDICDSMAGMYPKTFVFGGWHPNCYCYTVPVLASQEQFIQSIRTGRSIPGQLTRIPGNASKYISQHSDQFKGWSSTPYWLSDNFTLKSGKYVPRKSLKQTVKTS